MSIQFIMYNSLLQLCVTIWSLLVITCEYKEPSGIRSWNYQLLKMVASLQSSMKWDVICDPISHCRRYETNGNLCENVGQIWFIIYEWVQKLQKWGINSWRFSTLLTTFHREVTHCSLGSQRSDSWTLPRAKTINSRIYSNMLRNQLKPAIRRQPCGFLSSKMYLQHDNTAHHTVKRNQD